MYFCPVFFTAEKPEAQGESSLFSTRPPVHYPKHTCPFSILGFFQCRRCLSRCLPFFLWLFSSDLWSATCKKKNSKRKQDINTVIWLGWTPVWEHSCKVPSSCEKPARMHMDRVSWQRTHPYCMWSRSCVTLLPALPQNHVSRGERAPASQPPKAPLWLEIPEQVQSTEAPPRNPQHSQVLIDEAATAPPGVILSLSHLSGVFWGVEAHGCPPSWLMCVCVCINTRSAVVWLLEAINKFVSHVSSHVSLIHPVYLSCWVPAADSDHDLLFCLDVSRSTFVISTECKELCCHFSRDMHT